jgi:microcystin-dependent protein
MAFSEVIGTIQSGSSWGIANHEFGFDWQLNSQDVNANSSNITVKTWIRAKASGSNYAYNLTSSAYSSLNINDVVIYTNQQTSYDCRNSTAKKYLLESTRDVPHSSDGTKSVHIYAYLHGSNSGSIINCVSDTYVALPTIPREAYINSANIGLNLKEITNTSLDISFYNPANLWKKIQFIVGGSVLFTKYAGQGSSYNLSFTQGELTAIYNTFPNATSIAYKLRTSSYSDSGYSAQIGSDRDFDGTVSADATSNAPTFSNYTFADVNSTTVALTGDNSKLIKGKSNVTVSVTTGNKANPKNGASVVKYRLVIDSGLLEANFSTNSTVTLTLNAVTAPNITVYAIDSRGFATAVSKSAGWVNYELPAVLDVETQRKSGVEAETWLYVKGYNWVGSFSASKANEITKAEYRVRATGGTWSVYFDITSTFKSVYSGIGADGIYTLSFSANLKIHLNGSSGGMTIGDTFDVDVRITDGNGATNFNTYSLTGTVSDGKIGTGMFKDDNGNYHHSINGMPDPNYAEKVHGELYANGGIICPTGCVMMWSTGTAPAGWVLCDGSSKLRTDEVYAKLFAVIGTTFGNADSTHFNLPDMRGRVIVGKDTSVTEFDNLGDTGGQKDTNLQIITSGYGLQANSASFSDRLVVGKSGITQNQQEIGNLQPYIVLNYIIKL